MERVACFKDEAIACVYGMLKLFGYRADLRLDKRHTAGCNTGLSAPISRNSERK